MSETTREQRDYIRAECTPEVYPTVYPDHWELIALLDDADALEAAEAVVRAAGGFVMCECESCVEDTLHHCGAFAELCDALGDYHWGTGDEDWQGTEGGTSDGD